MRFLSRIAVWGLVSLIAVNISGTALVFFMQRQIRLAKPKPAMTEESKFPVMSGIDVQGKAWRAGDAPCRVIRIADDQCTYCKKDQPSYEKIQDAARLSSCEIIEMAPLANGMAYAPRAGVVQLQFVDGDVGAMLYPFITPQTIIVDQNWLVKMTKRGIFDDKSLTRSLSILKDFSDARLLP